jgi:hypothetical protein
MLIAECFGELSAIIFENYFPRKKILILYGFFMALFNCLLAFFDIIEVNFAVALSGVGLIYS